MHLKTWMWKIAVDKKEILLKVAEFKYSPFSENSMLVDI